MLFVDPEWFNAGSCYEYFLIQTKKPWQESRELCQGLGGDLAHKGIRDLNVRK